MYSHLKAYIIWHYYAQGELEDHGLLHIKNEFVDQEYDVKGAQRPQENPEQRVKLHVVQVLGDAELLGDVEFIRYFVN